MKLSIFSNDKTTAKDEMILSLFTLACMVLGIMLIVYKPTLWIISASNFVVLGVLLLMIAIMFIPCILYRLSTNHKESNK